MRPSREAIQEVARSSTRPSWCPSKGCFPMVPEYGSDGIGACIGVDLDRFPDDSPQAPDCMRLCVRAHSKDGRLRSFWFTIDEAARLGGALAHTAGVAWICCPDVRDRVDKMQGTNDSLEENNGSN